MLKLVLLRHGESEWNKKNIFTGWTDIDLTEKGVKEAENAGKLLKENGFSFDTAFTSLLKRAQKTVDIVLRKLNLKIPVKKAWRLNERHYGALQGKSKIETTKEYGEKQVLLWRRSYDVRPPALDKNDPRHKDGEPLTENLHDTVNRVLPCWHEEIVPELRKGKKVIIAAHGNSLRALVKYLDNISDKKIVELNIPTGKPLVYELDEELKPIRHYYLE